MANTKAQGQGEHVQDSVKTGCALTWLCAPVDCWKYNYKTVFRKQYLNRTPCTCYIIHNSNALCCI